MMHNGQFRTRQIRIDPKTAFQKERVFSRQLHLRRILYFETRDALGGGRLTGVEDSCFLHFLLPFKRVRSYIPLSPPPIHGFGLSRRGGWVGVDAVKMCFITKYANGKECVKKQSIGQGNWIRISENIKVL
jgi:hypothetical protein